MLWHSLISIGDGALDAVTADFNGNNPSFASVLLGNGDGTFVNRSVLTSTLSNPIGIAAVDLNGDGILDLAIVDNELNAVSIQLGNGDGTFKPAVEYPTGPSPNAIAVADFNNDGHPDLATPNFSGASVSIFLGIGDGSFGGHTDFATPTGPLYLAVADFNRDGKLDIAVTVGSGVSVLLGHGDGTFSTHAHYTTGSSPYGVVAGDFNHDGKVDLAVTNLSSTTVSILLGNGNGSFQAAKNYPTVFEPELLVAGDFNGDGKLDLAISQHLFSEVSVMLGNGDGTFPSHVEYSTGFSPFGLVVGDFNGDGKPDLATVNYGSGHVAALSLLLGNGDGTFQSHMDFPDGGFGGGALASGDLDGDGSLDFVFTNRLGPSVSVLMNKPVIAIAPSTSSFTTQTIGTTSQPKAIAVSNPGSAPLALHSIAVAGTDLSDFSATTNCPQTLQIGHNCAVNVVFDPQIKGNRQAFVDLRDNAPNLEQRAGLSGVATVVVLSPSNLSFGEQGVGTVSTPHTITLTNKGTTVLKIQKLSITGADLADFAIPQNSCGGSLKVGGSCGISIVFQPNKTGVKKAFLSASDDGGGSPQRAALTGIGK